MCCRSMNPPRMTSTSTSSSSSLPRPHSSLQTSSHKQQHSSLSTCHFLVTSFRVLRLQPCLCMAVCLLLCSATITEAFSVRWDQPRQQGLDELGSVYEDTASDQDPAINGSEADEGMEDDPEHHVDQYINVLKRWGHQSRFPWKRLRGGMCFRQPCKRDKECCKRYSICDRSAKVCVDCWYGSICKSERDCCMNYPFCARVWKKNHNGKRYIQGGKCVSKL